MPRRVTCFPPTVLFRRGLLAVVLFCFTGCGDVVKSSYSSAAAARADGTVARGWLPEELPDSAFYIWESHNLDLNTGGGEFHFAAVDDDAFRAKLAPASEADLQHLPDAEKLRKRGYQFYTVPSFVLAINWRERHVQFTLVFERDPS